MHDTVCQQTYAVMFLLSKKKILKCALRKLGECLRRCLNVTFISAQVC